MISRFTLVFISLCIQLFAFSQGTESFSNIPSASSTYGLQTWVGDNGLTWTATDARTDQTITGKAITIRNGALTVADMPNGISAIYFDHQQKFTGSGAVLEVYINNSLVGTVNPTTTLGQASFTGLSNSGNFDLEIRQVTAGNLRIAIDNIRWEGYSNIPACAEPTAQPTGLILTPGQTSISGSFTAASPAPDEYLIVRSTSPTLSNSPIDGTNYNPAQALGGGQVVGITSQTSFTDNGLNPNSIYHYFVYSLNSDECTGGPNYLLTQPLTSSATTLVPAVCVMPAAITNLSLTPANEFIAGSFTPAANANHYLVIVSPSATLGNFPSDGFTYTPGQVFGNGTVLSFGTSNNFTASDLTPNTTYYIFVFSANTGCLGEPVYNVNAVSASVVTTNTSSGIPTGFYSSTTGLTCQPLKTALKNLTASTHHVLSYTPGIWNAYQYTDIKPGTGNLIWDIYTDDNNPAIPETYNFVFGSDQCGNYNSEGDCYNREHTMPQSWFNDASPMVTDIHHILPTDGWVNGKRSNFPFGKVTSPSYTSTDNQTKLGTGNNFGYTGTVFEPIDAFKGDVARIAFYMATRYEDQIISQNWAGNTEASPAMLAANESGLTPAERRLNIFDDWYLKTLYQWHLNDPVSQKEIDRNNAIYYESGQANRNPFVDHPEFVHAIWACSAVLPVTISEFNAIKLQQAVLLSWNASYESNFSHFSIERSTDAVNFTEIEQLPGSNLSAYYFTDRQLPNAPVIYYRLKMVDQDGRFSISKIASVRMESFVQKTSIFPNPSKGAFKIQLPESLDSNGEIMVFDLAGRQIKSMPVSAGTVLLDVQWMNLPAGRYFIKIKTNQKSIHHSIVILK